MGNPRYSGGTGFLAIMTDVIMPLVSNNLCPIKRDSVQDGQDIILSECSLAFRLVVVFI